VSKTTIVIPARYASTRLAAKLLRDLNGRSVLQRTYEQATQARLADEVWIATDSQEILEHAQSFGANVAMTRADHQSGTDRIAELALAHPDWSLIINVQGDEPFINPADIDKAIEPLTIDPLSQMSSLYHKLYELSEIKNPNNVKVVTDINNEALYFSREAVPHLRGVSELELQELLKTKELSYQKHIGLYCYRRETLIQLSTLPQTKLEQKEKLEQLRALENGIKIKMIQVESAPIGIDTEEDLNKAKNSYY